MVGSDGSEPEATGFESRGWVFAGIVAFCFLVILGAVYPVLSLPMMIGLPHLAVILAPLMFPAFALGFVTIWSVTVATRGDE